MGTRASKQDIKVNHFFFKQVTYRSNRQSIAVSKLMMNKEDYADWVTLYIQVKGMQKQSLLIPQSHQIQTIKKFVACCQCPADYQMSICYENFQHLFTQQLLNRKKQAKFYPQEDLFFILYNFSIALKEFQINGKKFGDIRPSQIVVTNKQALKMINLASYPWQITSMQKVLEKLDKTTKFYLAPEQINALSRKTSTDSTLNVKAEAFSLGMTILEAALLQSSEDLYGLNPRTVNLQQLQKRLNTLQKKYPHLSYYLRLILTTAPQQRYSAGQLWSVLKIYSQKILQRHSFVRKDKDQASSLQQFRKKSRI